MNSILKKPLLAMSLLVIANSANAKLTIIKHVGEQSSSTGQKLDKQIKKDINIDNSIKNYRTKMNKL